MTGGNSRPAFMPRRRTWIAQHWRRLASSSASTTAQPIFTLFDEQPHWQTEILGAIMRVNLPAAFALFMDLLQRPTADGYGQCLHTARYISHRCEGEADDLIGFDMACEHLQQLMRQLQPEPVEIAFFAALIQRMRSSEARQLYQQSMTQLASEASL